MGNDITVPYSGHIPGGIHKGTDVVISGRAHHNARSFSINLCSGPNLEHDCALHFNPRFDENVVVRNHHQGGSWGTEERGGGMPILRANPFELHIKVHPQRYSVTLNNRHFCDFHHRLPIESVHYVYITGEVQINYIQFRGGHGHHPGPHHQFPHHRHHHSPQPHHHHHPPHHPPHYPPQPPMPPQPPYPGPQYPPTPAYPPTPGYPSGGAMGPFYNPPVPFTTPIVGGMYPGKIIYVSGVPHPNASRFTVNLLCGPSDDYDIGLHFDARFNYGSDNNQVIRNHKQGGNYGSEERHQTYFPFYPNSNFEMMILCEANCFKIAVNNQHFVEFGHRIHPVQRVDNINVQGDLRLTQVRIQ